MGSVNLILLVFAFVLTFIAAFWRGGPWLGGFPFPHLGWLGVALFLLSLLVPHFYCRSPFYTRIRRTYCIASTGSSWIGYQHPY
jgi:hypothetical protein